MGFEELLLKVEYCNEEAVELYTSVAPFPRALPSFPALLGCTVGAGVPRRCRARVSRRPRACEVWEVQWCPRGSMTVSHAGRVRLLCCAALSGTKGVLVARCGKTSLSRRGEMLSRYCVGRPAETIGCRCDLVGSE